MKTAVEVANEVMNYCAVKGIALPDPQFPPSNASEEERLVHWSRQGREVKRIFKERESMERQNETFKELRNQIVELRDLLSVTVNIPLVRNRYDTMELALHSLKSEKKRLQQIRLRRGKRQVQAVAREREYREFEKRFVFPNAPNTPIFPPPRNDPMDDDTDDDENGDLPALAQRIGQLTDPLQLRMNNLPSPVDAA